MCDSQRKSSEILIPSSSKHLTVLIIFSLTHDDAGGLLPRIITHASVGMAFSRVCLLVCLSVCPRSKRKTARAINTKFGTHILYSSRSACIEPEVKRSKVKDRRSVIIA